ncbi:MAG: NUDIX hydrolase [Pseudomonadota bacterium]
MSKLEEETLASSVVYSGRFLELRKDSVRLPGGGTTSREYVRHPGAVGIVALTGDGRVVLERQYRYAQRREFVEIPAGKLEPEEAHLETAQRELLEETGYAAREWTRLGVIHNAIGYSDEAIELWLAKGLEQRAARPEAGELLEVFTLPFAEALAMAADGRISDVKTIIGLFWASLRP